MSENPTEIVTIIIEDYVHTTKGLTALFAKAGLDKYWFPVSKMPRKGDDWPTVTEMVQDNHRLIVFTSDATKEAQEGVAYQWKYMVENECEYLGVKDRQLCLRINILIMWLIVFHRLDLQLEILGSNQVRALKGKNQRH